MTTRSLALIGNPNCGKTTLFNVLTGAHQKVGNWPGVTVEKKTGTLQLSGTTVELVDLPGVYSLEQEFLGMDEQIARDFINSNDADCIINILDASNLERNLVLTQQLLESGRPMIVALNMLDVAEQQGITVDAKGLSEKLGVEVVPIVAATGKGISDLKNLLTQREWSELLPQGEIEKESSTSASEKILRRYHKSRELTGGVVEVSATHSPLTERIDRWVLNRWLGIPVFLLMMYLMFMVAVNVGAVFIDFFDILFGAVFVDGTRWVLEQVSLPEWMIVLIADGLGGGIQLVSTFVPVIGFLYFCLSVLEDSGYMSRAAFVVDRLMGKIGLPGNAFVPLIVGFGCNVPSVMATRALGRNSDRLLTMTMAPFMSCGARLTVYALFAAAFFPQNGHNIVFMLYLLGIVMAVVSGLLFRKQVFSDDHAPSFQEMPAYHIPLLKNLIITTWFRLKGFVVRAGRTVVLVVVALSFLNSLSFDGSFGNEDSEKSALSVIGKAITPVFAPLGLKEDNWPATVGLFTGLFAKEAVVGTLDALYSESEAEEEGAPDLLASASEALGSIRDNSIDLLGGLADPLGLGALDIEEGQDVAEAQGVHTSTLTNMAEGFGSPFAAFCYLVLILLYAPCVAVLGAVSKEAGWRWMVLIFIWTTTLAYVTASGIYQIGTFTEHPGFSSAWLLGSAAVMGVFIANLKKLGQKSIPGNLIPTVSVS